VSIDDSSTLEKTINGYSETNSNKQEESKRKVKRVYLTLKVNSNDFEKPIKSDKEKPKPMNYKIIDSKLDLSKKSLGPKSDLNKCIRKKNNSQQKRINDKEIFGTTDKKVLKTQRYEKPLYNSGKYSQANALRPSKSTHDIKFKTKARQSPTKNFKSINVSKTRKNGTDDNTIISNLKSDKMGKYKTNGKDDKSKRHQRMDTWGGNFIHCRKASNTNSSSTSNLQNPTSGKLSKGYKAYLTTQRSTAHLRKKTSINGSKNEQVGQKPLIVSKSASKIGRLSQRSDSAFDAANKYSRQSLNTLSSDVKYMTKPVNRRVYDKPNYMTKSHLSKPIETSGSYAKVAQFRTSGVLSARTTTKSDADPQKSERKQYRKEYQIKLDTSSNRSDRLGYKKFRTKSKGEIIAPKETSSNTSKISANCASSLSKSSSRRKDKVEISKHLKKKSVAIPTRKTKALYSNKYEYERKRNSKAIVAMNPSSSMSSIKYPKTSQPPK
jgi:hypothetical protein